MSGANAVVSRFPAISRKASPNNLDISAVRRNKRTGSRCQAPEPMRKAIRESPIGEAWSKVTGSDGAT